MFDELSNEIIKIKELLTFSTKVNTRLKNYNNACNELSVGGNDFINNEQYPRHYNNMELDCTNKPNIIQQTEEEFCQIHSNSENCMDNDGYSESQFESYIGTIDLQYNHHSRHYNDMKFNYKNEPNTIQQTEKESCQTHSESEDCYNSDEYCEYQSKHYVNKISRYRYQKR